MEQFSDGCARIAHEFRVLRDTVAARGYLVPEEVAIAFLWYGIWPVEESLATHVTGYTLYMLNLRCTPDVAPEEWAARLDPANRPVVLRRISSEDLVPADPRVCAERLSAMFEKKREEYQAEADRLRHDVEEPAYLRKLKKATILTGADARWASRNYTDARIGFDRAHKALYQTLERDRELELDRGDHTGSSGPSGSEELRGCAGAAAAAASDPLPVPPDEVTPSPGEGQAAAADARTDGDQKSPNETRIAPVDLTELPPSPQVTAHETVSEQGVPFCATGGVAAPSTNPRPGPPPLAFATSRSAIQSRFHGPGSGPGQAPGPGRPPGIWMLCLLALGYLALGAAQGPVRCGQDPSLARFDVVLSCPSLRLCHSFPRSAWERRLRRSASASLHAKRTQSVPEGIPTQSVGTSVAQHAKRATSKLARRATMERCWAVRFTHPASLACRSRLPECGFKPRWHEARAGSGAVRRRGWKPVICSCLALDWEGAGRFDRLRGRPEGASPG
jgi:hypothetical protein